MKTITSMLLVLLLAACTQAPRDNPEDLLAMRDVWQAAFETGDPAAIAALYTEDGAVLPPNAETVTGREAIGKFWAAFLGAGINGTIEDTEAYAQGDLGYKVGTYTITDAEGTVVDEGKYVEVWKRENDAWQLHRDIFNSSRPAAAPSTESSADVTRVVVTAEVEDGAAWEEAFRTHGDLFRSMSQSVSWYGITDDNTIAVYSEPADLDTWMDVLESPETADAMEMDGVDRDSVEVYVLDRKFEY